MSDLEGAENEQEESVNKREGLLKNLLVIVFLSTACLWGFRIRSEDERERGLRVKAARRYLESNQPQHQGKTIDEWIRSFQQQKELADKRQALEALAELSTSHPALTPLAVPVFIEALEHPHESLGFKTCQLLIEIGAPARDPELVSEINQFIDNRADRAWMKKTCREALKSVRGF